MDKNKLKALWLAEENAAFEGWDFSRLEGRRQQNQTSWDYKEIILSYLKNDSKLLDMGTGGGEFLLTLNHPPNLTYVSEQYPPNVELCNKVLSPLGITVKQPISDHELPFDDEMFDIIINRHESFDMAEVSRILKPKGIFVTQQVGGKDDEGLFQALFPGCDSVFPNHNLQNNVNFVREHGFDILQQKEELLDDCFMDVGAIVYYAKIIVWGFPNFSVENNFSQLCKLQEHIEKEGCFKTHNHRFIIVAAKL